MPTETSRRRERGAITASLVYTFVDLTGPAGRGSKAALKQSLGAHPDATLLSWSEFEQDRIDGFSTFLSLLYVLLALSIVVSLFGMVNTQVLSVFERTREVGMLRAVGMTRRQSMAGATGRAAERAQGAPVRVARQRREAALRRLPPLRRGGRRSCA